MTAATYRGVVYDTNHKEPNRDACTLTYRGIQYTRAGSLNSLNRIKKKMMENIRREEVSKANTRYSR